MLYFAYGSNLNVEELGKRWSHTPRFVATAFWPDARLRFHYRSRARHGGALDMVPHVGSATPGVLFDADLDVLDRKEGVSKGNYRRVEGTVLTADGPQRAVTYRVSDAMRQDDFVAPTEEYVEIVRAGLAAFELPHDAFEAALAHADACWPGSVFVYGTLKRGFERAPLMLDPTPDTICAAWSRGRLVDLGAYPGLVRGEGQVHGELWSYRCLRRLFARLDPVEDFEGWDRLEASMYHRALVQAWEATGTPRWAWTYEYRGDSGETITSGRWDRS